jgi:hypothetical protein
MGRVELVSLNGTVLYDVTFYADICNPLIGSVIKSKVMNVNKFGILAEAEGVVEIIIAKNSVAIQSEVDVNKIRIGDNVLIEVVGKKFELNDKKISLIGRVVKDVKSLKPSIDNNFDEEEDDEVQEGGENEEDEEDEEDNETEDSVDTSSEKESESSFGDEDEDDIISEASGGELEQKLDGNFFSDDEEIAGGGNDDDEDNDDDDDVEKDEFDDDKEF